VLAEHNIPLNSEFFECLAWSIGDLHYIVEQLIGEVDGLGVTEDVAELKSTLNDAIIKRNRYSLESEIESLLRNYPSLQKPMRTVLRNVCEGLRTDGRAQGKSGIYGRTRTRMKEFFGISDVDCTICEFSYLLQSFDAIDRYFIRNLELDSPPNWPTLSLLLGLPQGAVVSSVQGLSQMGIMRTDGHRENFRLCESVMRLWNGHDEDVQGLFCRRVEGRALPMDAFPLPEGEVKHVAALLEAQDDAPVHILLYGAPGTGKTAFARSLARHLKVKAWNVLSREQDDEKVRRAAVTASLSIAARSKGAFVIVDEAERLLDTSVGMFAGNNKDKAWLNDFLETPGQRIVWITNRVFHLDQAVRRRFSHSIHFEGLGLKERKNCWDTMLRKNRVLSRLPEERRAEFAKAYNVPVGVIEKAVVQAKKLGGSKDFAEVAERVLKAHVTLSRNGVPMPPKREASQEYTLDGVTMEGSPQKLLDVCRRMDETLREGTPLRPTSGNMLFYGPPGTGKTALARYIARELQRECQVVPASQLKSKWIGETEKNIAEAFQTAQREGNVLVFDEADSFLFSRDIVRQPHDSSMVNEFLMWLEECRGLCICTTNRREGMDRAAMRRFAHKIEFVYAKPEQIAALYDAMLAPLAKGPLPEKSRKAMCAMRQLAPGDFHAVRSLHWLDKPGSLDPEALVSELRREVKAKLEEEGRHLGF
jgi:SpoVK/Ycf46/Vps4 family AAA+-type ATPase